MHGIRRLSLGIVLCALVGAACTQGGGATTAPAGTTAATLAPATSAPVETAASATSAPSVGAVDAAYAVFAPKAGATPAIQGGAALVGVGAQTQVTIGVEGSTETMAAGIQAGTCASPTPEMAYRLTEVASGASTTTVDVELATLLATPYVVNIFVMGSETESSIACGEIKAGVAP